MTALPIVTRFTEEEYLGMENARRERHEYVDGYIIGMAGASLRHGDLCANLAVALRRLAGGGPCKVSIADLRVHVASSGRYVYPDLVVACEERAMKKLPEGAMALTNPTLVVEVLSRSTRAYDRGQKLDGYRTIPSLQQVVLVDPLELSVEVWTRTPRGWTSTRADTGSVALGTLGALDLAEIFRDIAAPDPELD